MNEDKVRHARMRHLPQVIFLVALALGCADRQTTKAAKAVFESDKFTKPVIVELPRDLSRGAEKGYRDAWSSGFFIRPTVPTYGDLNDITPARLKEFLSDWKAIETTEIPTMYGQPRTYFRYTNEIRPLLVNGAYEVSPVLRLAQRSLKSIVYKNCYKVNPMGTGERQVCAFTFLYDIKSGLPDVMLELHDRKGKAKAQLDPDTGEWRVEELELGDPSIDELITAMTWKRRNNSVTAAPMPAVATAPQSGASTAAASLATPSARALEDETTPPDDFPNDPLLSAISAEDVARVEQLIKKGANVNRGYGEHRTGVLLVVAAQHGLPMIRLLVNAGANVNAFASDGDGVTALGVAAARNDVEGLEFLLHAGASWRGGPNGKNPMPALHTAAGQGSIETLKALLAAGADPTERYNGETAAEYARKVGQNVVIPFLERRVP